MSVISRWLEDSINQAGTAIGKQLAPLFGQSPEKFAQQQITRPTSQILQENVAAPILRNTLQRPGVAPIVEGFNKVYENAWRRPITTGLLLASNNPKFSDDSEGKSFRSFKDVQDIWDSTGGKPGDKGINLPSALVEIASQGPIRNVVGQNEAVQKYLPWLKPDFNITDPKQRTQAFEESWSGAILTGGLSLLQMYAEGRGAGYLMKMGRLGTGLEQTGSFNINHSNLRLNLASQTDEAVKWFDEGMQTPTPNGVASIIKDFVPEKNVVKIESSPFVQNLTPEIRFRAANLIANATSAEEVGLIMRSHWGDGEALNKLWNVKASAADAIDDFGLYNTRVGLLDRPSQLSAVVDDLAKSNVKLAEITKSWIDDMGQGVGITNWAPSKFASIEEARSFFAKQKYNRRYGVIPALERYEKRIKGTTIQSTLFARPIHVLQNLFNEKPKGMVDFSDPRGASDAAIEILAEINRVKELRAPKYTNFKQNLAKLYGDASTDTQRSATLKNIEQETALNIGRENGLDDVLTLEIYKSLKDKTTEAQNYVAVQGHLPMGDTSIVLPDPLLRSQMASNYILLDFKLFDRAIKDFKKTGGVGKKQGQRKGTAVANLGDYVNNIFSHVTLIRPGYIPKNSIVEPAMRILALGDATRMLEQSLPATKRLIENNANRGLVAKDVIWDAVKGKTPKRFREQTNAYKSDLYVNTQGIKQIESKIKDIDKKIGRPFDEVLKQNPNIDKNYAEFTALVKTDFINTVKEYDRTLPSQTKFDLESTNKRIGSIVKDLEEGKGFTDPLGLAYTVDKDGNLVVQLTEGNHRLAAAKAAGIEYVPVTVSRSEYIVDKLQKVGFAPKNLGKSPLQRDKSGYIPGNLNPKDILPSNVVKSSTTLDERVVNSLKADKEDLLQQIDFHNGNIKNLNALLEETSKEFYEQASFRAKLRNKKTAVTENAKFTLASGEEISVPAGRSTAAKGGAAMQSEIDPNVATWQAAGQTFASSRLSTMRQQIKNVTIRPGDADYWTAYAKDVNVNVKNDEVVKMWANGVSREDAKAWLTGQRDIQLSKETIGKSSGLFYRKQILERRPEFQLQDWEEQFVNEIYDRYDILVPDSELRNEFLSRNVDSLELEAKYGYKTNLPEIDGNASVYPQGISDRIATAYNKISSWGYGMITAPERILFRNTFYDMSWNDSVQRQITQAERMGVEVTPQLVNDRFRFVANAEAINKVEQTFYTVRRNNNLNYALRFLTGFPTAIFNSYKFWAKNIAKNPYNAVLQYKFQNMPYDFGTVVNQDGNAVTRDQKAKDGEQRYLLLGTPAWADKTNLKPYQKKLNVQQWNFLLGNISGSWIVQVGLSELVSNEPAWAKALQDVVGKGVYNQLLFGGRPVQGDSFSGIIANTFSPGYLDIAATVVKQGVSDIPFISTTLGVTKDEPAFAERMNLLWNTAMFNWKNNGFPEGQQPKLSEIKKLTYKTLMQDAIEKWASPLTPTNQPVSQFFKDQKQFIIERYKTGSLQLPANKTPQQAATETMNQMYGIDVNRFYVSTYNNATNMEKSQLAYNNFKNNSGLVSTVAGIDPELLGIITNPDTPGEYDPAVSSWMQRATAGEVELAGGKKTFDQMQSEFEVTTGFKEYSKLKDKYASLTNGRRLAKFPQLQAQFNIEKEELVSKFPAWGIKMQSGYEDRTNNAIMTITAAVTDAKFMNSKVDSRKWQTIYTWLFEREKVWNQLQNASTSQKKFIKERWADREQDLVNSDTSFADFHAQYLDNDKLSYGVQHFSNILKGKNKQ
jgi:hypothetical protein